MENYLLIHEHRHGTSDFFFSTRRKLKQPLTKAQETILMAALEVEFEPEKEEGYSLIHLNETEFKFVEL